MCFVCVCSIPLPSEMNVILRYYLDWFDQLLLTVEYYMMILTNALFFVGACIYIGGMGKDLKETLAGLDGDSRELTRRLCTEIAFHNHLME